MNDETKPASDHVGGVNDMVAGDAGNPVTEPAQALASEDVTQADIEAAKLWLDVDEDSPWEHSLSEAFAAHRRAAIAAHDSAAADFRIGSLTLRSGYGGPHSIEIMQAGGEAGDFPVEDIEALLQAYYKDKF